MYWPSKAREPSWWPEWMAGDFGNDVIERDLDLLVGTGSNTVRIFIPYRNESSWGFTDGVGGNDNKALEYLVRFIEIAKSKDLFVVPNVFQEMEVVGNGGFPIPDIDDETSILESNRGNHESFMSWFMGGIRTFDNIPLVIIKNEPDGYEAWASEFARHKIMEWLVEMYAAAREAAPNIRLSSVSSTHDNLFVKSPHQPVGEQSLYEISDVVMWNAFLWADNGHWHTQVSPNWLR